MAEDWNNPPRRRRHLWAWLLGGFLLVLVVVALVLPLVVAVPLDRQVEQRIAELRAQGYPTSSDGGRWRT